MVPCPVNRTVLQLTVCTLIFTCAATDSIPFHSPKCTVCSLAHSLLNSPTAQSSFVGELYPIAFNPSESLIQGSYPDVPHCLVPKIYENATEEEFPFRPSNSGVDEIPQQKSLNSTCEQAQYPFRLSPLQQRRACLFGCTRVLLSITFSEYGNFTTNVVVITEREALVCPRRIPFTQVQPGAGSPRPSPCIPVEQLQVGSRLRNQNFTPVNTPFPNYRNTVSVQVQKTHSDGPFNNELSSHSLITLNTQSKTIRAPPSVLCSRVFSALRTRHHIALGNVNRTVPYAFEKVTRVFPVLYKKTGPVLDKNITDIQIAAQCIFIPRSLSNPRMYSLYAIRASASRYSCPLQCTTSTYRYLPTGQIAEFFFAPGCVKEMFQGCPQQVPPSLVALSPLNTQVRSPIPSIVEFSDARSDRKRIVQRAIELLRRRNGFGGLKEDEIFETKVKVINGKRYQVIVWFYQRYLNKKLREFGR